MTPPAHRAPVASALTLALIGAALTGPATYGGTVLSGSYNNGLNGYITSPGQSYIITSPATFDDNRNDGLSDDGSAVTVNGGTFQGNGNAGLLAGFAPSVIVNGGTFTGNAQGLVAQDGSAAFVTGGDFGGNGTDLYVTDPGSSLTLYGTGLTFNGMPGATVLVGQPGTTFADGLKGTITGTLQNGTAPVSLSFAVLDGATITLDNAVPEPPALALLGLGVAPLALRGLRRRRRTAGR